MEKYVQFETSVRHVEYRKDSDNFFVTSEHHITKTRKTEVFDYVITCTGYAGTPYLPTVPGTENLSIRVMHAHDIRNEFRNGTVKDKKILLVGAAFTSEDVALLSHKFGAKKVFISYHNVPFEHFPKEFTEKTPLKHFSKGNIAHFQDGTSEQIDLVIFCTGYRFYHPFLENDINFEGKTEHYHPTLYQVKSHLLHALKKILLTSSVLF